MASWLILALAALLIALFAVNAIDDSLSDQARAMLRPVPNALPDNDNLYVLLAGLDAPAGQSMLETGRRNLAEYRRFAGTVQSGTDLYADVGRTPAASRLQVNADLKEWSPATESVWDRSHARTADIKRWADSNRELLARYEILHRSVGYHNTSPPGPQMPLYSVAQSLRTLYLADIARRVRMSDRSQQDAALQSLVADLDMWQRMLLGEGVLIDRMLATAYLHADLLLLSDMLADNSVPLSLIGLRARGWLTPQPRDKWKIGAVFAAEYRYGAAVQKLLRPDSSSTLVDGQRPTLGWRIGNRLGNWFYLPSATLNLQSARMAQLAVVADTNPSALLAGVDDRERIFTGAAQVRWFAWGRNPVGKTLALIATPAYPRYPLRVYNVATLQRALVLSYRIRESNLPDGEVAAFIATNGDWAANPANGSPLTWDAEKREVRVTQLGAIRPDRRFTVRIR